MVKPTILVVDDEPLIRLSLSERLTQEGHRVLEAGTASEALDMRQDGVDLVLLDYRLPDATGLEVLKQFKEADPDVPVILLTAYSSVDAAVEVMKHGAYHYARKPFDLDDIALLIKQALETKNLRREVRSLRATQAKPFNPDRIVGQSATMASVRRLLLKVAASPASTVLLMGESGTGKDLAAKVIHFASGRSNQPFMNITCSALPESLLESELFGHERGAFTSADRQRRGLLESADGGTLFLDEVGEMMSALQVKLLRFLEERSFKRVGGTTDIHVDVRVIAATNRNLSDEVREGRFREDLYYRLNVVPVILPPLRERAEDIPLLVRHYVDVFNLEFRKRIRVSPVALERMQDYGWPGNVRELRNGVERAMLLAEDEELGADQFLLAGAALAVQGHVELPADGIDLEVLERSLVTQALERSRWNQTRAAVLLGLNRDQIRYRIEKFGLMRSSKQRPGDAPPVGQP